MYNTQRSLERFHGPLFFLLRMASSNTLYEPLALTIQAFQQPQQSDSYIGSAAACVFWVDAMRFEVEIHRFMRVSLRAV